MASAYVFGSFYLRMHKGNNSKGKFRVQNMCFGKGMMGKCSSYTTFSLVYRHFTNSIIIGMLSTSNHEQLLI